MNEFLSKFKICELHHLYINVKKSFFEIYDSLVVITVQGLLSLKPRCIINLTSRCLVLFQIHLMIRSSVKYLNQCFVCNLLPEEKKNHRKRDRDSFIGTGSKSPTMAGWLNPGLSMGHQILSRFNRPDS